MYTDFFGLKEKPFNLTPSSRFLYLGESHKEALALLTYGVDERKGFILLTGEVGTGKTTMVQALLGNLDHTVEYVYLSNPLMSVDDLMNYLAFSALKKKVHFKSKSEFLLEFESFLKQCLQHQKNFVLIIDEAQKLSFELLEEIRLLSNMETADEKLINIFLVGQPELNEHLSEARCRPLLQRISVRHHISPLNLEETAEYVMTRMSIAGTGDGDKIFPKRAIKALHDYSSGYPRMINILADNALLLSYSMEKKKITPDMIKACYDDMKLEGSFLSSDKKEGEKPKRDEEPDERKRRPWKWVAVLIVVLLAFAFGVTPTGRNVLNDFAKFIPNNILYAPKPVQEEAVESPQKVNGKITEKDEKKVEENRIGERKKQEKQNVETPVIQNVAPPEEGNLIDKNTVGPLKTITVERGDTLLALVAKVYGFADEKVLDLVQRNNPDLKDIDRIEIGQQIAFPRIDTPSDRSPVFTVHVASFKPFEHASALFEKFMNKGYEVYVMPVYDPQKGKVFRVTLGSFKSRRESDAYAAAIRRRGVADYAESIQLEMR